jgi:hypothetical protein
MGSTGTVTYDGDGIGHGIVTSEYDLSTYELESRLVHDSGEDEYLRRTLVAGQVDSCGLGGDWPDRRTAKRSPRLVARPRAAFSTGRPLTSLPQPTRWRWRP